jgi:hypothetical protein
MSFTTVSCVLVECDDCDQVLEIEDGLTARHSTRDEEAEHARADRWLVADSVHLCESCAYKRALCQPSGGGAS